MKSRILLPVLALSLSLAFAHPAFAGGHRGGYSSGRGYSIRSSSSLGHSYSSSSTSRGFKAPVLHSSPSFSGGTYSVGGTRYKAGEYYKTTGLPKVERSEGA